MNSEVKQEYIQELSINIENNKIQFTEWVDDTNFVKKTDKPKEIDFSNIQLISINVNEYNLFGEQNIFEGIEIKQEKDVTNGVDYMKHFIVINIGNEFKGGKLFIIHLLLSLMKSLKISDGQSINIMIIDENQNKSVIKVKEVEKTFEKLDNIIKVLPQQTDSNEGFIRINNSKFNLKASIKSLEKILVDNKSEMEKKLDKTKNTEKEKLIGEISEICIELSNKIVYNTDIDEDMRNIITNMTQKYKQDQTKLLSLDIEEINKDLTEIKIIQESIFGASSINPGNLPNNQMNGWQNNEEELRRVIEESLNQQPEKLQQNNGKNSGFQEVTEESLKDAILLRIMNAGVDKNNGISILNWIQKQKTLQEVLGYEDGEFDVFLTGYQDKKDTKNQIIQKLAVNITDKQEQNSISDWIIKKNKHEDVLNAKNDDILRNLMMEYSNEKTKIKNIKEKIIKLPESNQTKQLLGLINGEEPHKAIEIYEMIEKIQGIISGNQFTNEEDGNIYKSFLSRCTKKEDYKKLLKRIDEINKITDKTDFDMAITQDRSLNFYEELKELINTIGFNANIKNNYLRKLVEYSMQMNYQDVHKEVTDAIETHNQIINLIQSLDETKKENYEIAIGTCQTTEDLVKILEKIQKEKYIKNMVFFILSLIVLALAIYCFVAYINKPNKQKIKNNNFKNK